MRSAWISGVRSVALNVPDLERARAFYTEVWRLDVVATSNRVLYLSGSGADHHLLALHENSGAPQVRHVTLRARDATALLQMTDAALLAGGSLESASEQLRELPAPTRELSAARATAAEPRQLAPTWRSAAIGRKPDPSSLLFRSGAPASLERNPGLFENFARCATAAPDPAGGLRVVLRDPHGRRYEVVYGDAQRTPDDPPPTDAPQRIAHAVLNSHDVESAQTFLERAFGFVLADRTRIMAFMNCDSDHHSLALADADNDALNHIAFVMPSLDAVMRGGGRLRDAGHAIEWGPGRHGPGDNVFNYFIDPFGIVIEYTAEVEQIDNDYQPGSPTDWGWPAGRTDQWGICPAPSARLKTAQRAVSFARNL